MCAHAKVDEPRPAGTLSLGEVDYVLDITPPTLVPVESSAIAAIGYDATSRSLFVRFRAGGLYAYLDVPEPVARAFQAAPSKGGFFQDRIDPVFRYARLEA